jgi:pyruvate,water dikinase
LTSEKVEELINPPREGKELKGWAASPGVCEGVARVINDPVNEWGKIKEGDILVTSFLSPAQVAVFGKIKGLVTNGGGVMSHPAIVAREYGIPAVVGTGSATSILKDGTKIRLDGGSGSITILEG